MSPAYDTYTFTSSCTLNGITLLVLVLHQKKRRKIKRLNVLFISLLFALGVIVPMQAYAANSDANSSPSVEDQSESDATDLTRDSSESITASLDWPLQDGILDKRYKGNDTVAFFNTVVGTGVDTVHEAGAYSLVSLPKDKFHKPTEDKLASPQIAEFVDHYEISEDNDNWIIKTVYKEFHVKDSKGIRFEVVLGPEAQTLGSNSGL